VGLHGEVVQPAAGIDAAIGVVVQAVARVQAVPVDIERVRVLHGELAHPQQARLGPGLVAELRLDLVPDLGKLPVGAQLVAGDGGEDLLVGHAQAHVAAPAVLEAEHVVAHDLPAAGGLPDLRRVDGREVELLAPDPVHLLADDLPDAKQGALGQRQVGVDARRQLADESAAQQQDVAHHVRLGGHLAQGGHEIVAQAHASLLDRSPGQSGNI